jgi:hypothetical protein
MNLRRPKIEVQSETFGMVYQVCNLASVAWPAAALSGAPVAAREGPQGRLAAPRKKEWKMSSPASILSSLQSNDISIALVKTQKSIPPLPGFRAVRRAGGSGAHSRPCGPP